MFEDFSWFTLFNWTVALIHLCIVTVSTILLCRQRKRFTKFIDETIEKHAQDAQLYNVLTREAAINKIEEISKFYDDKMGKNE